MSTLLMLQRGMTPFTFVLNTQSTYNRPGKMDGSPRISKLGTIFSAAIQGGTTIQKHNTSTGWAKSKLFLQ